MSLRIDQLPISRRLRMNAAMVPQCDTVADIGCDHAYSSIYLVGNGLAKRCIAMDVAEGPLAKARENIEAYGLKDRIETRLSDGLEKLQPQEAQVILISGMGGPLMINLLKARPEVTAGVRVLVLQPQSELAFVRRELSYIGFAIQKEDMCCEDGKYYTVMYAEADAKKQEASGPEADEEFALRYGRKLLQERHPVLIEFMQKELRAKCMLYDSLSGQSSERAGLRRELLLKEIGQLKTYLGE